jgi:hypothetical protein
MALTTGNIFPFARHGRDLLLAGRGGGQGLRVYVLLYVTSSFREVPLPACWGGGGQMVARGDGDYASQVQARRFEIEFGKVGWTVGSWAGDANEAVGSTCV